MWGLAEETVRGGADAFELAAEAREIQVGLEDLVLRPRALERPREPHLPPLLTERARARRTQSGVEQRGDLHGDRARAAPPPPGEALDRGGGGGPQIDAAVLGETSILRRHHRGAQRGRYLAERNPRQTAAHWIDAPRGEQLAVSIEEACVGRLEGGAHGVERRCRGSGEAEGEHADRPGEHDAPSEPAAAACHLTSSGELGSSPNVSGEYRASTRVGGSWKVPGWLSRMTYSTTKRPFGT